MTDRPSPAPTGPSTSSGRVPGGLGAVFTQHLSTTATVPTRTPTVVRTAAAQQALAEAEGLEASTNGSSGEIFVSPRVIDRRAYSELAGSLKDLVDEAGHHRAALTSVLDQTGRAMHEMRTREQSQQENLELAAMVIKRLEDRSVRIESLIERSTSVANNLEQLENKLGGMIDERCNQLFEQKLSSLEAKLDSICAGAAARVEALEERLKRATRELEQRIEAIRRDAQNIVAPVSDSLMLLCDQAHEIIDGSPASLRPLLSQARELQGEVQSSITILENASRTAQNGRADLEQWANMATTRVGEIATRQQHLDDAAQSLVAQCEQAVESLRQRSIQTQNDSTARVQQSIDQAQGLMRDLEAKVTELKIAGDSARNQSLGAIDAARSQAEQIARELTQTLTKASDASNTTGLALKLLERSSAQVNVLLNRLEPWQGLLENRQDAETPEPIRRLIEGVRSELRRDLSTIADALRNAAGKADRAVQSIDASAGGVSTGPSGRASRDSFGAD